MNTNTLTPDLLHKIVAAESYPESGDSAWRRGGEIAVLVASAGTVLVVGGAPMRSPSAARALVLRSRRLRDTAAGAFQRCSLHRAGCRRRAAAYTSWRASRTPMSRPRCRSSRATNPMALCRCSQLYQLTKRSTHAHAGKNVGLFCKLLWLIASRYRRAERIHMVVDNYGVHKARRTRHVLAALGGRIVLHFLPPYCPDANRIERVWQDLHANITRNHRCKTMVRLVDVARRYLDSYRWRRALKRPVARQAA